MQGLFTRATVRVGSCIHFPQRTPGHRLLVAWTRWMIFLLFVAGPLWPGLAHAGPSTECPPTQIQTVASGGTFTANFISCSVFGLSGVSLAPSYGSLSGVDPTHGNGTGLVTYVANQNPSSTNSITDHFTVLDDEGDTIAFTVTILPNTSALTVSPTSLPTPVIGQSYSAALSASGGKAPYAFSVTGLPPGLTFNTNTISGTPTGTGSFVIVVNVTDSTTPTALTGTEDYTVTIAEPVLTAAQPPAAAVNVPYSYHLSISGGTPPYSNYQLVAGHGLPAGLSLSGSGLISGTPAAVGTTSFEFTVYDSTSGIAPFFGTVTSSLTVNAVPPITLSPSTLGTLTVGVPTNQTITPSGGSGVSPYAFSIGAGTLPAGLSLSTTTGVLSGTPTAGGSYSFTISVHDGGSGSGSLAYSGTVQPATIAITPTTLAAVTQATAYSAAITASGGTAPYTYAVSAGSLPTGVTLNNSTGALSGTPTVYGNFNFTVTATDSSGGTHYSGSRSYTLTINPSVPTITPATLPNPVAGVAYSQTLAASGGNPPYTFAISSGSAPQGISLLGNTLSGTPTATGVATFTVQVTDAAGTIATRTYSPNVAAPTITITPAALPAATLHVAYSQPLAAQGGTAPYTFSVASGALPPGLHLGTDGTLSGSPSAGGNFNFTVAATDSTRNGTYQGIRSYSLTVAAPTITLTPGALPAAAVSTGYGQSIGATGGTAPYTFAVTSGNLPAGLQLSSSGTLSGTPSAGGTVNFSVTATDANTNTGTLAYSLTVNAPTLSFTPAAGTLNAPYGSAYSQNFAGSGGTAPYTFVLTGALPNGLSWNPATATLSGTPTQPGSFPVSITMTDSSTGSGPFSKTNNYTVTVAAPTIVLAPATLPPGGVGTAYAPSHLTASGGVAPYTYSIVSGTLPAGLSLSSSGTLSGTPTAAGSFNMTARATDANGISGQQSYTVTIAAPSVTLNPATLPVATAEAAYSQSISAAGGTAPYTYSISSGALPAGLSLDPTTGALAGTPTVAGTFIVSITAHDSSTGTGAPFSANRNYTLTVNAPSIVINPTSLPNAKLAAAYSQQFSASGGNGTYTYLVGGGALPAGLNLSNSGRLSGMPTGAGSFNFTVTAIDGLGLIGSQAYTLSVAQGDQTITGFAASPANPAYATNGTFMVSAAGGGSANPVTFSIAAPSASVCSINDSTVTTLAAGTCTVLADQAGNTNYSAAPEVSLPVMIAKASQTITFGAQPVQTYVSGGTFAISPLATASSGLSVTYSSQTSSMCTVSNSTVTIVSAGTCTLAADQAGNGNYLAANEATQSVTIGAATSGTTLTSSAPTAVFGQSVTLTATVTGQTPTGSVTFNDGATVLCSAVNVSGGGNSPTATCSTSTLGVGAHAISASYTSANANNGNSSANLSQTVNAAATTTTITPPASISLGQSVTVSASVAASPPGAGTPTGTIAISAGDAGSGDTCTITLPATSCSLTPSSAGALSLSATYSGDTDFAISTGSANLTVSTASSSVILTSSPNPSIVGQAVTFTATVSTVAPTSLGSIVSRLHAAALAGIGKAQAASTLPTGSVTFSDGSTLLATVTLNASGVATYSTTALTAGSHTISASYSGDLNNAVATITDVQQVNSPSPPPASAVATPMLSTWMLALLGLSLVSAGVGYARRRTMR